MLSAVKIRTGCLLMGILLLGGGVIRVSGCASKNAGGAGIECMAENSSVQWMEEKYRSLEEEEMQLKAALQEAEESLSDEGEEGWEKAEELKVELRHVRVQKQILKARLEEYREEEE